MSATDRSQFQGASNQFGTVHAIHQGPGQDQAFLADSSPFQISDSDASRCARRHRRNQFRIQEGVDITLTLYPLFISIHRIGDINGQDERQVNALGGSRIGADQGNEKS